jgi:hypothetical protein
MKPLESRILEWRRTRKKRCAMPEELWVAAASFAREYGINRVAESLGLGYYKLKKVVENSTDDLIVRPLANATQSFVELPLTPGTFGSQETVTDVDVVRPDGTHVRLRHSGPVDVVKLVSSLWGAGECYR